MCNYLGACTHVYLVACSNMRALLHAYLFGLEALDLFFVRASVYMHRLSLCALRHNNGSDVCASSKCPGETVHLPRLVGVVDVRITDSFVLLFGMCFKKFLRFRA